MAGRNPKIKYDVTVNVKPLVTGMRTGAKAMEKLRKKADATGKATEKATRETRKFKDAWDGIKKLGAGSGTRLGQLTADIGDLGEGLTEVGGKAGLVLGVGAAFTAVAVAGAAAMVATVRLFGAWKELTVSAAKLAEEMHGIKGTETGRALTEAAEAADRLDDAFGMLQITLAAKMGPEFIEISDTIGQAAFGTAGLIDRVGDLSVAFSVLETVLVPLTGGMATYAKDILGLVAAEGEDAWKAHQKLSAKMQLVEDNLSAIRPKYKDAAAAAKKYRAEMEKINAIAFAPATDEMSTEATRQAAQVQEISDLIVDHNEARLFSIAESNQAAREDERAALATAGQEHQAHFAQMTQWGIESGQATMGIIDQVLQARLQSIDLSTAAGRDEARKLFAVQKASSIAQATMATAAAVMQNAGAYPMPWALIPMGIAATVGTAQVAMIAAQPPPFALGGIVPDGLAGRTGAADHSAISAMAGEAVLNRRAVEQLGDQGVAALNMGASGGGQVVVVPMYQHRVFDAFVVDNLAKGGPLAGRIDKRHRPGRIRRT